MMSGGFAGPPAANGTTTRTGCEVGAGEQKTCFVNLPGIGLQFAAVGAALYRKALAAGCGHKLPMDWFTEDVIP